MNIRDYGKIIKNYIKKLSRQENKNNPCLSCGLCCAYYPTVNQENPYVNQWSPVYSDEIQVPRKLYKIERKPYQFKNVNHYIRSKKDKDIPNSKRCVSLSGQIGIEVKCDVHSNRPRTCRDFPVGGTRCDEIREWGGLEPLRLTNNF